MRISRLLTIAILAAMVVASSASAQTDVPVARFRSVQLQNGGQVILRHGQTQRVRLVAGSLDCTQIRVDGGQQLRIDNHGGGAGCGRHERLQIEVVTPMLESVAVANGGTIRSVGDFPVQGEIEAAVEQGGGIDLRSMAADAVEASIQSGGRIFVSVRQTLTATVESGGIVKYWGDPRVRESVRNGGVVAKGD
jgi:hypothetical protein